ncbi:MAG TPA: outer membrane lipoprotein carrier protein LolA [Acidobacteriota bacterium]|nr:outer membrane lipoprotein carrier protein LolA [Acidobacteriota bacterium]
MIPRPAHVGWAQRSRSRLWLAVAAVVLPCLLLVGPPAAACDADTVITLFESEISAQPTLSLEYHKEARSLLFGEREPEDGKIWLGPPNRYRVETPSQTIVRGSDTLWTYSDATNQVTIRAGGLDSLEFGPVGFFGSLRKDFFAVDCRADKLDKAPIWKIRLAAKTETAAIQRLTLWIDTTTYLPRAAEYVDYNEETTSLTFSAYRPRKTADEKRFIFEIPDGAEVVVLPSHRTSGPSNTEN